MYLHGKDVLGTLNAQETIDFKTTLVWLCRTNLGHQVSGDNPTDITLQVFNTTTTEVGSMDSQLPKREHQMEFP